MWRCPRLVEEGRNQTKGKYKVYKRLKFQKVPQGKMATYEAKMKLLDRRRRDRLLVPDKSRRYVGANPYEFMKSEKKIRHRQRFASGFISLDPLISMGMNGNGLYHYSGPVEPCRSWRGTFFWREESPSMRTYEKPRI
jgi:hypothetical protein